MKIHRMTITHKFSGTMKDLTNLDYLSRGIVSWACIKAVKEISETTKKFWSEIWKRYLIWWCSLQSCSLIFREEMSCPSWTHLVLPKWKLALKIIFIEFSNKNQKKKYNLSNILIFKWYFGPKYIISQSPWFPSLWKSHHSSSL